MYILNSYFSKWPLKFGDHSICEIIWQYYRVNTTDPTHAYVTYTHASSLINACIDQMVYKKIKQDPKTE